MTALEQMREDQALGAAWRRAEAALPDGWLAEVCDCGATLTAVLTALADALEARKANE